MCFFQSSWSLALFFKMTLVAIGLIIKFRGQVVETVKSTDICGQNSDDVVSWFIWADFYLLIYIPSLISSQ